jgi:60 kDa SS-A/Ro ribonucleoprotein
MASLNKRIPAKPIFTHEGAPAVRISAELELRRSVLATLLWEDTFYESGVEIGTRIQSLAAKNDAEVVSALAMEARNVHGLRHAPLLLLLDLIKRGGHGVAGTITNTIRRADEITELAALYWKFNPNKDFSWQMKKGLAGAFNKFDEYQFAKYNRDGAVKLRDVLFLSHPKAKDSKQQALFDKIVNNELAVPDTWETNLSGGKDKKETFERLLSEGKLGYLALLRNLRNMVEAGVDRELIRSAILARKGAELVFPFRFTAAARAAPTLEKFLDEALIAKVTSGQKFEGRTVVAVDVSGSMNAPMSGKSDLRRQDAAATLASVINGDKVRVITFDTTVREVPHRIGMAGVDAILRSGGGGTYLGAAVNHANAIGGDRLIVITDEQSHDRVGKPQFDHAYMINVSSYRNGVGYNDGWTHIDGFSEAVLKYIFEVEKE